MNPEQNVPQEMEPGRVRVRRPGRRRRAGVGREGRGMERPRPLGRAEILAQQQARREERRRRVRDMIDRLDVPQIRDILHQVAERQPGLLFDIWERQPRMREEDPVQMQPDWCSCTLCHEMPQILENLCCRGDADNCISTHPLMNNLVLDPYVLGLAEALRNEVFGLRGNRHDPNRARRHAAYRQFILWQYHRLGRGNRRVIPSCVVLRIRAAFPDPRNVYVGYVPNRLI